MEIDDQASLFWTGVKKKGEDNYLCISVKLPQVDVSGCYAVIEIEGLISEKKIYAEDPISALINALIVIRDLLDPPSLDIEDKIEITRDLLPLLRATIRKIP